MNYKKIEARLAATHDTYGNDLSYKILTQNEILWKDLELIIEKGEYFSFYCKTIIGVPKNKLIKEEISVKRKAHVICENLFDEQNENLEMDTKIFFYLDNIKIYYL